MKTHSLFHTAKTLVSAILSTIIMLSAPLTASAVPDTDPMVDDVTQGALRIRYEDRIVESPLKHTDVDIQISGFIARARVSQTFVNPYNEPIEAVYVFPLPHTAAVDGMDIRIEDRHIVGVIKHRDTARRIYEQALSRGQLTALLEQERPNIFTQSVGNIPPYGEVNIEISYVDVLKYDMGTYEMHFPMVVGPRFIPGSPVSGTAPATPELSGKVGTTATPHLPANPGGTGWAPDTDRVPDASRITPPVLKPGYRTGHDISLNIDLEAGVPIQKLNVVNHMAHTTRMGGSGATVTLSPADAIPNKDFVLRYDVVGGKPEMALLPHAPTGDDGYFMLMVQPRLERELFQAPPREIVFLIDVSGSMSGQPTQKVKETMKEFFNLAQPADTFQVITFASQTNNLFARPVPVTRHNVSRALNFTQNIRGGGGTHMLEGIRAVLNEPVDSQRVRIVMLLTDGYIGNEAEIIEEVGRRSGDQIRFWALGIGSSPNRFLLDGVANAGGGMSSVIELGTDPKPLVSKITERIHRAQLSQIDINWNNLAVYETFPRKIPELWAGRPVIVYGRYAQGGDTRIDITGMAEGKPLSYSLDVSLPAVTTDHAVLAKVWARQKIEDLSAQMFYGNDPYLEEAITEIALDYSLMSAYTSFVAVDETQVHDMRGYHLKPRRMVVPVPIPDGVSYHGVFGTGNEVPPVPMPLMEGKTEFNDAPRTDRILDHDRYTKRKLHASQQTVQGVVAARPDRTLSLDAAKTGYARTPAAAEASRFRTNDALVEKESDEKPLEERYLNQGAAISKDAGRRHREALRVLEAAEQLKNAGNLDTALRRAQLAYALETAHLSASTHGNRATLDTIYNVLISITADLAEQRTKSHPALSKNIDLTLENKTLDSALETIAQTAGLSVRLDAESLSGAKKAMGNAHLDVVYLALQDETAAQALNALLVPRHLWWEIAADNVIIVQSIRRFRDPSAWVYPVQEFIRPGNNSGSTISNILAGLRTVIGQSGTQADRPGSATILDPHHLLVYGNSETHQKVSFFLEALTDSTIDISAIPARTPSPEELRTLKTLQQETIMLWTEQTENRKRLENQARHRRLTQTVSHFAWPLLAERLRGHTDPEATAQLRSVIGDADFPEILHETKGWKLYRALWAVSYSSVLAPQDRQTSIPGRRAIATVTAAFPSLLQAFADTPGNPTAFYRLLYATLTLENAENLDPSAFRANAAQLAKAKNLFSRKNNTPPLATPHLVANLLFDPSKKRFSLLEEAISQNQIIGDDLVLLTGLISGRSGNQTRTFREELPRITGSQPLQGYTVILANRLADKL
jgi:Ca-activated chloride channel family protein